MNKILLNIFSSSEGLKPGFGTKDAEGRGDFFSLLQGLSGGGKAGISRNISGPVQDAASFKDKKDTYIEFLRKAFLAKGKSLDNVFINKSDINLLEKYLLHCGFQPGKVENILKDLLEKSNGQEISISNFFKVIDEYQETGDDKQNYPVLGASAVPHVESLLRALGIDQKRIDHILENVRSEHGEIYIDRLVGALREIKEESSLTGALQTDKAAKSIEAIIRAIVPGKIAGRDDNAHGPKENLTKRGKEVQVYLKADSVLKEGQGAGKKGITIEGVIEFFKRISRGPSGKGAMPGEIRAEAGRILERASIHNDNGQGRKIFSHLVSGQRSDGRYFEREKSAVADKTEKEKGPADFITRVNTEDLNRKAEEVLRNGRFGRFSNQGSREQWDTGAKQGESHGTKPALKALDTAQGTGFLQFGTERAAVEERPVNNPFPAYLIKQIGKQISRSIIKGDRVLKLQLRPPDLGALKVQIDIKDNVLKLGLVTENNSVRELLLSNVNNLRESLTANGIKLERMDVDINQDFSRSMEFAREGGNDEPGFGHENGYPDGVEDRGNEEAARMPSSARSDLLLDLVA